MSWFFIALIGTMLVAITNHTDKYILSKYLAGGAVGALIIFSAIFSVVALPIVLLIQPDVFSVSLLDGLILAVNGMLVVLAVLLYLYAMHEDEASYVVPFFQTIPVFGFILGYFILGETISISQSAASVLIIFGAMVLSLEFGNKLRFKKKVVLLMLSSSVLYAINGVLFKLVAINDGFWLSIFWSMLGQLILGILFLLWVPTYRVQFITMFKENKIAILGLNSLNEIIYIVGMFVTQYATLLAPVVLVMLVNSFQPLFVLIIGVVLTLFFPSIGRESLSRTNLIQKVIGIGLILAGSYFLGA